MQPHALTRQTVPTSLDNLRETSVKGIGESNMTYHTALEKGKRPHALGAIDDLIRHNKVPRLDLLLQTADRGKRNDGPDTQTPQGGDVGAIRHLVRRKLVVETMARDEGDGDGLSAAGGGVVEDADGGGGLAPRRVDVQTCDMCEARERLQSGTANDGDWDRFCRGGVGKRRRAWGFIRSYQSRSSQRSPSCESRYVLDESGPRKVDEEEQIATRLSYASRSIEHCTFLLRFEGQLAKLS